MRAASPDRVGKTESARTRSRGVKLGKPENLSNRSIGSARQVPR